MWRKVYLEIYPRYADTIDSNTVIRYLLDLSTERKKCGPVMHFYFDGNQRDVLKAEDLMRSCIKQLLRHLYQTDLSPSEVIRLAAVRLFKIGAQRPTYDEIVHSLLIPLIRQFQNLTIAVDGLDVCSREECSRALETLNEIREVSSVKIFVSGRGELEIARRLPKSFHVRMTSDGIGSDIALFVIHSINVRMRDKRLSDNRKTIQCMKQALIERATGM